jgi:hypothetical protein
VESWVVDTADPMRRNAVVASLSQCCHQNCPRRTLAAPILMLIAPIDPTLLHFAVRPFFLSLLYLVEVAPIVVD